MIAGVVGLLRTLGSRGSVMDLRHEAGAEVPRTGHDSWEPLHANNSVT